jgi:hypothetical protein
MTTATGGGDKTKAELVEAALITGDLSGLKPAERLTHYMNVCQSLGLNPHTKPFGYLTLNGKTVLYALREAAEQLRKVNGVSIEKLEGRVIDDLYVVTATAKDAKGRVDSATGAVTLAGLRGDAKANAIMKAETKAKRRVTLSICGLGMLDESEIHSIQGAAVTEPERAHVDVQLLPPKVEEAPAPAADLEAGAEILAPWASKLGAAKDLDDLKAIWATVPANLKPGLTAVKDGVKASFGGK